MRNSSASQPTGRPSKSGSWTCPATPRAETATCGGETFGGPKPTIVVITRARFGAASRRNGLPTRGQRRSRTTLTARTTVRRRRPSRSPRRRRRPWRGAYGRAIRSGPQTPSARPHGVAYARRRRPARRPCRGPGGARSVRAREDAGADARPGGASLQRRPLRRAEVPKSRFLSATGPNSAGHRRVRRLQVHYEEG